MEETTAAEWEQKMRALTDILTHPTTSPSLYSHFLFPYRHSIFSSEPRTSWRSKCPYQQPPPLILARGVEAAKWDDDEKRREYVRMRIRRKPVMSKVNPLIPFLLPNFMLLSLLLWNPFPEYD